MCVCVCPIVCQRVALLRPAENVPFALNPSPFRPRCICREIALSSCRRGIFFVGCWAVPFRLLCGRPLLLPPTGAWERNCAGKLPQHLRQSKHSHLIEYPFLALLRVQSSLQREAGPTPVPPCTGHIAAPFGVTFPQHLKVITMIHTLTIARDCWIVLSAAHRRPPK